MFDDFCTEAGARALAEMIRGYWQRQGRYGITTEIVHAVTTREAGTHKLKSAVYGVRSNCIDGYPPREIAA